MNKLMAISSWSGGKDSCLACYKAIKLGYDIKYLLNFISKEHKRCCFHGIESRLVKAQAEAVGIPIVQKEVSPDMQEYEKEFKEAVNDLRREDIDSMVFGDIYLEEHQSWVERVCGELKITPVEPLWKIEPAEIIEDFIGLGFRAVVVSCKADIFGREFIGRTIDTRLLAELKRRQVCPCGENGEFHTLVVDGPIFKKRIEITKAEPVLKEGFWKHWFLDIQDYKVA